MSLPISEPLPYEPESTPPPIHRRRKRKNVLSLQASERAQRLEELAHRVIPSFDFFVFSLLSGLTLGLAILLNAPALYVLAALFAPFMAPILGLSLAGISGSFGFFLQSLGSLLIGSLFVFGSGALAGWISHLWPGLVFVQTTYHASFSWADLAVLILAAGLSAFQIVRSPSQRPLVASVALAYELYLPLGVAGFGLIQGSPSLWPGALTLFLLYLAIAALTGAITLSLLGFRPVNFFAYIVLILLMAGGAAAVYYRQALSVPSFPVVNTATLTSPVSTPSSETSPTQASSPLVQVFATWTPEPPTAEFTPTKSLEPSGTPTETVSPMPTPIWAKVNAKEMNGIVFRDKAGFSGKIIGSLLNGNLVEVLSDTETVDSTIWIHIRTVDGRDGWVQRILLITATPVPGW
jgi:hypothetical protein